MPALSAGYSFLSLYGKTRRTASFDTEKDEGKNPYFFLWLALQKKA